MDQKAWCDEVRNGASGRRRHEKHYGAHPEPAGRHRDRGLPAADGVGQEGVPMTTRWLFVMRGGIAPDEAIGPYQTEEEERALIVKALQANDELLCEDGEDSIHWIEIDDDGRPTLGSFTCGFMDDLREAVHAERGEMHG